jgi:hypothetical protein
MDNIKNLQPPSTERNPRAFETLGDSPHNLF